MVRKSTTSLIAISLISAMALAACGKSATPAPQTPPAAATGKPALGGEWVRPLDQEPDSFHPAFLRTAYGAAVSSSVLGCGLLDIDENWEPFPCLAKAMPKISADNKTYTFELRDDIYFHDGVQMTADDVVYTYKGIYLNPEYTGRQRAAWQSIVADVKATGKLSVEITLKDVYAAFLVNQPTYSVLPKHILEKTPVAEQEKAEFSRKPVGVGPYKFMDWKAGQYVLLEANDKYFKPRGEKDGPWIKTIRMKIIPDDNTRIAALEAGEIEACLNCPPQHVERLKQNFADKLTAYDWPRNGFGHIRLNNEKWPTSEKVVRQALTYALNRPAIIQGVLDGKAIVPPGPIPNPVSPWYNQDLKPMNYDKVMAEKLLDDAGYTKGADGVREKDGKKLVLNYRASKGSPIIDGIALQAQKDWKAIGVDVKIELYDFNTLLEKYVGPGDFHAAFFATGPGVDPDGLYNLLHSSEAQPDEAGVVNGNNTARFRNQRIDDLLEKGRTTTDKAERKKIYDEVQAIFADEAPWILTYSNMYTDFIAKKIKGVVNVPGFGVSFMPEWYIDTK